MHTSGQAHSVSMEEVKHRAYKHTQRDVATATEAEPELGTRHCDHSALDCLENKMRPEPNYKEDDETR